MYHPSSFSPILPHGGRQAPHITLTMPAPTHKEAIPITSNFGKQPSPDTVQPDQRQAIMQHEAAQWMAERLQWEAAVDALRTAIDARDLKIEELTNTVAAIERDLEHKRGLLTEREAWYRQEYVRRLETSRLESLAAKEEGHRLEVEGLKQALQRAENELAELAANAKAPKDAPTTKIDDLLSELEDLRKKLGEKIKQGKNENKLLEGEKESILSEMMVKGYAKENLRLMNENAYLRDETKVAQDALMRRPARVGDYEIDQLKDSVKQLQVALETKESFYKKKEDGVKGQLDELDGLRKENEKLRAKLEAQNVMLIDLGRDLSDEKKQRQIEVKEGAVRLEQAKEERDRIKKEASKVQEEGNRVRNENLTLKKDVKNLKTNLNQLEQEIKQLKENKEVKELNIKIKSLNQTISDLKAKKDQSTGGIKSKEEKQTLPSKIKVVDHPRETYSDTLDRLASETIIPEDCRDLIAELASRLGYKKQGQLQKNTIPIRADVDILASNEPGFGQDQFYGLDFDVDDYLENERRTRRTENNPIKTISSPNCSDDYINLVRGVIRQLSKTDLIYKLEQEWQRYKMDIDSKGMIEAKTSIISWRGLLESYPLDIGQGGLVNQANKIITLVNRGDLEQAHQCVLQLDSSFYSTLGVQLPQILKPSALATAQDDRDSQIEKLKRDKAALEDLVRQANFDPKATDFAVLSRKIDVLEQRDRLRALETAESLKALLETKTSQDDWLREREKLIQIIKTKNRELTRFRQEVDELLLQLRELRAANN